MNTITLNIGYDTSGGFRLSRGRIEKHLRSIFSESEILFTRRVETPGEPTLVVTLRDDGYGYTGRVNKLAAELFQDCIAFTKSTWQSTGTTGIMAGSKTRQYGTFTYDKFITQEQAMSYGNHTNPQRLAIGDKVVLSAKSPWHKSEYWAGVMTVDGLYSSDSHYIQLKTAKGRIGAFAIDMVERYVEPAKTEFEKTEERLDKLEKQVAEIVAQATARSLTFRDVSKTVESLEKQTQFLRGKVSDLLAVQAGKLAAPKAEAPAPAPQTAAKIEFTAEELSYLKALTGKLCGDSLNTAIFYKLDKLALERCALHFDLRGTVNSTPGVWKKASMKS